MLSAIAYCGASLALSSGVPLVQFGFEPVVIGACVIGLLFSFGKFRWAPAMTLLCVSGTILIASVLVYKGMLGQVQVAGQDRGWSLKPWLMGRVAAALVFAGLAAAEVVSRDRRAWASMVRAAVACVPLALAAGGMVWVLKARAGEAPPPQRDQEQFPGAATPSGVEANASSGSAPNAVSAPASGAPAAPKPKMPGWLSSGLLTFLGIAAGVSLCAAGHYFIRAFEIGADVAEGRMKAEDAKA